MSQRSFQARRRQQRPRSPWVAMLIPILAILITFGLFYLLVRTLGGGAAPPPTPTAPPPTATQPLASTPTPELATPTPEPTATPELPTPTPAVAGPDVLRVGGQATVNADTGLRMRSGPGTNFDPVSTLPPGAIVEVIGGPERADTYTWWQVRFRQTDGSQLEGWVAGDFLDPGAG